jgi:hypothetical protein
MSRPVLILLLLAVAVTACNGGSSGSPSASTTVTTVAATGTTSTSTTTTTSPGLAPSTTAPTTTTVAPAGYALDLATVDASGFTAVHMSATSCGSIEGLWHGSFDIDMETEALTVVGAGPISFTLESGHAVTGEAPFVGTGFPESDACEVTDLTEPLSFEITLDPSGSSVTIVFGSKAGTSITFQCRDAPPIAIPFAVAWGPQPIEVPITTLDTCN